ncbi:MAG: CPP1-like family protein [Arthrospira sp. SH-MAG29]|nr:CPP1-like family protein [Arthrospira sp. SH-MAG29]MBS0017886.1 CPP1-like family protein [Arthrospira sp. SH-MAG29]
MSQQSPYEQLGVTVDASFDEIQDARDRLREKHTGERQVIESIEAAYDAILMDRLRMRQEGKIKVPERIRFPERIAGPPAKEIQPQTSPKASWLTGMLDAPSRSELMWPSLIYLGLGVVSLYPAIEISLLQLPLALGVATSLYFLNRKENKFGRSVLLTVGGLILGLILGSLLSPMAGATLSVERFITLVTLIVLWLVSSFLR